MSKNLITNLYNYINENENSNTLSVIIDGEIRVNKSYLMSLLNSVGEGIDDINSESNSLTGKWTPNSDEYQNEVTITFVDNAWGGISIEEWNKADEKLKQHVNKNGFIDYTINPRTNMIVLEFDPNFEMALY